ncbi:MAG: hypothetical protein ACLQFR_15060 [Streptosporangiaceae bacterium]
MDTRECAQCGALFAPRREHARFCSAGCRVTWNRRVADSPSAGEGVLDWSFAAMLDVTDRLLRARVLDRPRGYALITEAVWWCTMVDATLVRYHPDTYSAVLADRNATERRAAEDTFAGLRFVRNQMGYKADHDAFIRPSASRPATASDQVAAWTWKPVPQPSLASLPPRGREWEMTRYRAYQAQLADHRIGETFTRAADFLRQAADASLLRA